MPIPEDWHGAGWRMPDMLEAAQEYVMPLLTRHGVLTAEQLACLIPVSPRICPAYIPAVLTSRLPQGISYVQSALKKAEQSGWVESGTGVRDNWGTTEYWWATEEGRKITQLPDWVSFVFKPGSSLWQHSLSVNDFCVAAHTQTEGRLGRNDWQHEPIVLKKRYGRGMKYYRSDAFLMYHNPDGSSYQFLELDRGTHPLSELVDKQKIYRSLTPTPEMPIVPDLIWCFDDKSFHIERAKMNGIGYRMGSFARLMATEAKAKERSREARYDNRTLMTTLSAAIKRGVGWTMFDQQERSLWPDAPNNTRQQSAVKAATRSDNRLPQDDNSTQPDTRPKVAAQTGNPAVRKEQT